MSKIKNGGLDQYGAEPFKQHRYGTSGIEGVKAYLPPCFLCAELKYERSKLKQKPLSVKLAAVHSLEVGLCEHSYEVLLTYEVTG